MRPLVCFHPSRGAVLNRAPTYDLHEAGMAYGTRQVLRNITLQLRPGRVVSITGPNGAGKSTLLSILAGLKPQYTGLCLFEGADVRRWRRREFAKAVAVVPQSLQIEFPFTAEQVVLMGRTPFCDGLFEAPEDIAAVRRAMAITDTADFRERDFRSLSGGERQRVVLASALAQTPRVLLLDEPTTFLDPEHQVSLFRILRDLAGQGILVVNVTHDLNLALAYSDELIMLRGGELRAAGAPADVANAEMIRSVFSIDAQIHEAADGRRWILYGR